MLRPNRLGCAGCCIAAGLFVSRLHIDHTYPQFQFVRNSTCAGPSERRLFRRPGLSAFCIKIFSFERSQIKYPKMGTLNPLAVQQQLNNRQKNFYLFLQRESLVKLMTTFQLLLNSDTCNGLYKKICRFFFAHLCITR